ncbi:hypothetical protein [uncultured Hyphomonas sp.]|jgi:serine O-acetyltransferase|uniref:serine O-acetyltransferase n=1 Tax=uncultured Hyphomonas sp. TaxID=225298 RepID=UPI000C44E5AE|nr:serine acetyltransferase [Hyphomonadaceae bacterium]MBA28459.1 serine acetyltransferase [Hyphomonadaceae bacterium]MBL4878524.1 hypothetical protein [Hyphomonas sp.]|tara:strand:+ start:259 stop:870 length:612 start_codon:yes stop_codon:yes gene_type:complete
MATDSFAAENVEPTLKGPDLVRSVGFWKLVGEDFATHGKQLFAPGFHAMLVYRWGTWAMSIRFRPIKFPMLLIYVVFQRFVRNFYGIELERNVRLGRRVQLVHQHGIVIHKYAQIGNDVMIRHSVTFGMAIEWIVGHGPIIGSRVSISPGVVVAGNIVIGDDVSIGPNCTVTQNVPAGRTLFIPPPRSIPKPEYAQDKEPTET